MRAATSDYVIPGILACRSRGQPQGDKNMFKRLISLLALLLLALPLSTAWADEYSDTISIFKNAGESGSFFGKA